MTKFSISQEQMVREALEVHAAQGTLDSPLAKRLRECLDSGRYARPLAASHAELELHRPTGGSGNGHSAVKKTASEKSVAFATNLIYSRETESVKHTHPLLHAAGMRVLEGGSIDQRTCSDLIDVLKALPYRQRAAQAPTVRQNVEAPAPLEPGFYRLDGDFYKVKISKSSGRPYAEKWDGYGWDYESGKGAARKLTAVNKLTAEDAKMFGDAYGKCIFKGCALTHETSIRLGYGPICGPKNGFPWG